MFGAAGLIAYTTAKSAVAGLTKSLARELGVHRIRVNAIAPGRIWTEKQNYGRTYMGMVRTTYLIDAEGKIAKVWDKVKVKGHAQAVLEAAQAL
jgi:NAD(P)-dependent dehydrogenase (short-subunit alcohol dehydrogenase family)